MLFVSCPPSFETHLQEELSQIGFSNTETAFCGVEVPYSLEAMLSINYASRIATRVLFPLITFACSGPRDFYEIIAHEMPWEKIIPANATMCIDVNGKHPAFSNTLYAAQLTKDAICDYLRDTRGFRPTIDKKEPDIQLNLFLHRNECVLSLDTSGQPLFKRGYRQSTGPAPLQESLAAALLHIAKYQGTEDLIDPCCGSGTLLIEAGLMATKTPPGSFREHWGFFYHPDFDSAVWENVKHTYDTRKIPFKGSLKGLDSDRWVIESARQNIAAAGLTEIIHTHVIDFRDYEPQQFPNFMITNPPHGVRLNVDASLYRALGDFMKRKMEKPSRGFIFTTDYAMSKEVGLKAKRYVVNSSGLEGRFLEYDIY